MHKTLLLFLAAIAFKISLAQNEPNCYVQQFTTENGLPSNVISGLQWDEETGFLWMATGIGIVRFNGIDFKVSITAFN